MSPKAVLFFLVSASLAAAGPPMSENESQTLQCLVEDNVCVLEKVTITRSQPRFQIRTSSPDRIRRILFDESTVEVLEETSICETFPNLEFLDLYNASLEAVKPDVFRACRNLISLDLSENRLKVIEPETLEPLKKLKYLYFNTNNLTELHLSGFGELLFVYTQDNYLKSFSISNVPKLMSIVIHTNELPDINANDILAKTPDLFLIEFNSNPIPCSKVEGILTSFWEREVIVFHDYVDRDRPYEMQELHGIMCV